MIIVCCYARPVLAATTISIAPHGEIPWSAATEITVLFTFDTPAKEAWASVASVVYELDGRNATTSFTRGAQISSPSASQIRVTAQLRLDAGEHKLVVSLTPATGAVVQASGSFVLVDQGSSLADLGDFEGAAPFLLWPDQEQVTARAGKVALEGSFHFNMPGSGVIAAGFFIDSVQYFAEDTGSPYFTITLELAEGAHIVESFIADTYGYTYKSLPSTLTLTTGAPAHSRPTHATPPRLDFSQSGGTAQRSGGVPTHELAGRFHLQLEVTGPLADSTMPGGARAVPSYEFKWLTYQDAAGSFDSCPPVIWRGNDFLWEYKFVEGDWRHHHMKLSGTVSNDGRLLQRLDFSDAYAGPQGDPVHSTLACTFVDVPLAEKAANAQQQPLQFAFAGERWLEYLIAFRYDYFDTTRSAAQVHYDLASAQAAQGYVGFW